MSYLIILIIFQVSSIVCAGALYASRALQSKSTLDFLVMGDWGTFTARSGNGKRLLFEQDEEVEDFNMLNNNGNANNNNKNNNNANNNNNNNNEYWSVLVAKAMASYASSKPADFLLALGDNFYSNGVSSVTDSLWTQVYTNVYNYDSLQIPWYAVFGNHDYGSNKGLGSLQAQIDFGEQGYDNRWHAGYCYKQSFSVPESATTVDIVFIDTTLIAPEETYVTSSSAGVSQQSQQQKIQEQLSCLEYYLASSTASFLVVAGHYPIFSTGKNSPGDVTTLVENLYPILEKYKVDVYFCGHDHLLQHLQYSSEGSTMDFVISGAAGKPDNSLTSGITSSADMKFAVATGGFVFTSVTPGEMVMDFVDYTGAVIYSTTRAQTRSSDGSYYSGGSSSSSSSGSYEGVSSRETGDAVSEKDSSSSGGSNQVRDEYGNSLNDDTNQGKVISEPGVDGADNGHSSFGQSQYGVFGQGFTGVTFDLIMEFAMVIGFVAVLALLSQIYRSAQNVIAAREKKLLADLENTGLYNKTNLLARANSTIIPHPSAQIDGVVGYRVGSSPPPAIGNNSRVNGDNEGTGVPGVMPADKSYLSNALAANVTVSGPEGESKQLRYANQNNRGDMNSSRPSGVANFNFSLNPSTRMHRAVGPRVEVGTAHGLAANPPRRLITSHRRDRAMVDSTGPVAPVDRLPQRNMHSSDLVPDAVVNGGSIDGLTPSSPPRRPRPVGAITTDPLFYI